MKTTEIFADSRAHAICRGCGVPIVFAQVVKSGRQMPFDRPLVAVHAVTVDGRLIEEVDLGDSHFASCKQGDRFRKAR